MSTLWIWVLVMAFALIKIPIALLMLWVPFHNDRVALAAATDEESASSGEDEGGSKALPASPRDPHPRMPLRGPHRPRRGGPHGAPAPTSQERVRRPQRSAHVTHT